MLACFCGPIEFADGVIMYDETKAVADSLADGSVQPLKNLFTAGTAVGGTEKVADHVAASRSAQLGIKSALSDAGIRETGALIGRRTAVAGKFLGAVGAVLATKDAYAAYKTCMQQ